MKTMWITATWETSHEIEVPDDYEWDGRSIDAEWADQVVADEVAPSLRWATAQVKKIERDQASRPTSNTTAQAAAYDGEEPF